VNLKAIGAARRKPFRAPRGTNPDPVDAGNGKMASVAKKRRRQVIVAQSPRCREVLRQKEQDRTNRTGI
jgi:hypothetical protein